MDQLSDSLFDSYPYLVSFAVRRSDRIKLKTERKKIVEELERNASYFPVEKKKSRCGRRPSKGKVPKERTPRGPNFKPKVYSIYQHTPVPVIPNVQQPSDRVPEKILDIKKSQNKKYAVVKWKDSDVPETLEIKPRDKVLHQLLKEYFKKELKSLEKNEMQIKEEPEFSSVEQENIILDNYRVKIEITE